MLYLKSKMLIPHYNVKLIDLNNDDYNIIMSSSISNPISVEDYPMSLDRQQRCWNAYMAIYKNKAFSSKELEGWVYDKMCQHPELCKTTLIYHNEDRQDGYIDSNGLHVYGTDDKIRDNIMFPIPIYWGGERDDLFDWQAVRKGLGYNKMRATYMPAELRDTVRYAIVGPVKVKGHRDIPEHSSHVIHTEGINLESPNTATFKTIMLKKNKEDILSEYYKRHRAILKLIIEAAMSQTDGDKTAFIQAPMIGAGCFLQGIKETNFDIDDFLMMQCRALESTLEMAPPEYKFTYKLCIYNTQDYSPHIIDFYDNLLEGKHGLSGRFELGKGNHEGNVLKNVPFETATKNVFVVNPGDLRSFIGNGMSYENSVEGYIVANAKGYNPQWQNTSFLHNPYFNPALFNPIKAANKGNIVWRETMSW
tara:strand:- start:272 stop:1531 length:1260 start_codon:yes stop_codon:yes gene_type:complete